MFSLIDWLSFGEKEEGIRLKLDVQGQGGRIILDVDVQEGGGLQNWTIFTDVICASSLNSAPFSLRHDLCVKFTQKG